jgi:hypothetical protein
MLDTFKKIHITNIFNRYKKKLQEIAKEFNLNYNDLEDKYLIDMRTYIENTE